MWVHLKDVHCVGCQTLVFFARTGENSASRRAQTMAYRFGKPRPWTRPGVHHASSSGSIAIQKSVSRDFLQFLEDTDRKVTTTTAKLEKIYTNEFCVARGSHGVVFGDVLNTLSYHMNECQKIQDKVVFGSREEAVLQMLECDSQPARSGASASFTIPIFSPKHCSTCKRDFKSYVGFMKHQDSVQHRQQELLCTIRETLERWGHGCKAFGHSSRSQSVPYILKPAPNGTPKLSHIKPGFQLGPSWVSFGQPAHLAGVGSRVIAFNLIKLKLSPSASHVFRRLPNSANCRQLRCFNIFRWLRDRSRTTLEVEHSGYWDISRVALENHLAAPRGLPNASRVLPTSCMFSRGYITRKRVKCC